jgi:hypothetical protein
MIFLPESTSDTVFRVNSIKKDELLKVTEEHKGARQLWFPSLPVVDNGCAESVTESLA